MRYNRFRYTAIARCPEIPCLLPSLLFHRLMPKFLQRFTCQSSLFFLSCLLALSFTPAALSAEVFVEAESFSGRGGWSLDTQFIKQMGSPYLLAHGLGRPVDDAVTQVDVPEAGEYRLWVRTIDWVARWGATPSPGQFQVIINGTPVEETFGTKGAEWSWHDGGLVDLAAGEQELRLHDLTGFDGRCDCLYFTSETEASPPPASDVLSDWRRQRLGLPRSPLNKGPYDLVVVGGGYSGMGAAISAARMGCRVALVQDRPVLGGNGSSEVRVWAMGNIRRGKFPRIGEIVDEFADHATKSPGRKEEFGDDLKERVVRAEPNIDLMLNHFVHAVEMDDATQEAKTIRAIRALDTRTGEETRILGDRFVDCTGHGWIGAWSEADFEITPEGRMGMSNMWRWDEVASKTEFPETPWALDLTMRDFPYPRDHHGQWFWESGFDKDPIGGAEAIRDLNLRAVYGAFNAMKNRDGAEDHQNAVLTWVAFIGGPRESRRLMGDVVLTQEDIVSKREFPDGCVPSTWSIDLHYPKKQYADKFPEHPFISVAVHDRRVDRMYGYPVPYRCFYSRNVDNLFMAGRCVSVTHRALGTVRVMKTCGMMGEVVGKAASICTRYNCTPREVYKDHLDELLTLLELPGKARRSTVTAEIEIGADALPLAGPYGPPTGTDPTKIEGIVVDDDEAEITGDWSVGTGLKQYVGHGYRYASPGSDASAVFTLQVPAAGHYQLELFSQPHENRGTQVPVTLRIGEETKSFEVNQRDVEDSERIVLHRFAASGPGEVTVTIGTKDAGGFVHADAVRLLPIKTP